MVVQVSYLGNLCECVFWEVHVTQNNLELTRTLDDSWNAQDWDTFEKRHSKDTTVFWPGQAEPTRGRDNHKAESVEFFKTFPDNHLINHHPSSKPHAPLNSCRFSNIQEQELARSGQDVTMLHVRPKASAHIFADHRCGRCISRVFRSRTVWPSVSS